MAAYGLIGLADGVGAADGAGGMDGAGDAAPAAGGYPNPQALQQGAMLEPAQPQSQPQPQPPGQGAQALQSWLRKTRQEYRIPGGAGAAADTGPGTAAGADMGMRTGDGGNVPRPQQPPPQQPPPQRQQRQGPQPQPMPATQGTASPPGSPAYAAASGGRDFSSLWR